jgi:hypothetical protein
MEVIYVRQLKDAHFRQNAVAFWNLGQFLLLFAGQKEVKNKKIIKFGGFAKLTINEPFERLGRPVFSAGVCGVWKASW